MLFFIYINLGNFFVVIWIINLKLIYVVKFLFKVFFYNYYIVFKIKKNIYCCVNGGLLVVFYRSGLLSYLFRFV